VDGRNPFQKAMRLFTVAKSWNKPRCPSTDEWIKKVWNTETMEYYSVIKKMKSCHLQEIVWNWRLFC
jgi:hypothetical protein